jgi:hypothetical protein
MSLIDMIETLNVPTADSNGKVHLTQDKLTLSDISEVEKESENDRVAYATDYAVMNGSALSGSPVGHKNKPTAWYFLRSIDEDKYIDYVSTTGFFSNHDSRRADFGIRPKMRLKLNEFLSKLKENSYFSQLAEVNVSFRQNYHTITFGEFPKTYVGDELNALLEFLFGSRNIKATGRKWVGFFDENKKCVENEEFIYEGQRFVRVKTKRSGLTSEYQDGTKLGYEGTIQWARVEPITWIIKNFDAMPEQINPVGSGRAKTLDLVAEECLMSGIPFSENVSTSFWKYSLIRGFLNTTFLSQAFATQPSNFQTMQILNSNF